MLRFSEELEFHVNYYVLLLKLRQYESAVSEDPVIEEEIEELFMYFDNGKPPRQLMTQVERQRAIYHYFVSKDRNLVKGRAKLLYSTILDPATFWSDSIEIMKVHG